MKVNFHSRTTANIARAMLFVSFIIVVGFSYTLSFLGLGVLVVTMILASFVIGVQAAFRVIDRGVRTRAKK